MRRHFSALVSIAFVFVLVGCGPAGSLFPLFAKSDKEFDERLLGEWRIQSRASFKHKDKSGRMVFRKSAGSTEYEVTLFDFDEKGMNLALTARIVRLGDFTFIDFGTPDANKRKFREIPFPAIESHFFGRIQIEKASVRMDLLSDEWVKQQHKASKPLLDFVQTADGPTISASTEELRKFALEHAEDKEAFSEPYSLSRTR
ncbi:MAG: hypothetical protein JWN63_700 [Candidatus Acidoferrum typicum]|jgi:hypothetical protein|nr:hypothetical protein [Candidatus Acidoferrum typicum]